jgi:FkbM family methyltransferase
MNFQHSFSPIRRLKDAIKSVIYWMVPHMVTYSQAGEDAVLRFLFDDKKIDLRTVTYLDIGTSIPDSGNNTYLLYKSGATGVCVEADKTLIPEIKRKRPKDTILNVGIAVGEAKEGTLHVFNPSGMNTLDPAEAEERLKSGKFKLVEKVTIPLVSINELIGKHFATHPTFLSIDIEGLDLAVLQDLDLVSFPIPVICAETCLFSDTYIRPKNTAIVNYLIEHGYEVYADTYINTIFVNKNWFYNV